MFFISSRRRHTRCSRDWSSDVCSSDLEEGHPPANADPFVYVDPATDRVFNIDLYGGCSWLNSSDRSEERRVGKESREQWKPFHLENMKSFDNKVVTSNDGSIMYLFADT